MKLENKLFKVICMYEKITLEKLEQKLCKKITWFTPCNFYAISRTKQFFENVLFYQSNVVFGVYCMDRLGNCLFEESYQALDIYYTDTVLFKEVQSFISGKISKVKRANPLKTIGQKTLLCLDINDRGYRFLDINKTTFKQLLSIAQAKQKYSREVNSN